MRNLEYYFLFIFLLIIGCANPAKEMTDSIPVFEVDPFWPKPLQDNKVIGQVAGVAIDSKDHIWIVHRPKSIGLDEVGIEWNLPEFPFEVAPPVIEFDEDGNMIQAWGGPGDGFDWPESEHGLYVDYEDNVWLGGAGKNDHQVLKFSPEGKFLLQIGRSGETGGSNDPQLLGYPAEIDLDSVENEVYIADGYLNKRVIVFDAQTGRYKRHWGAYGNKPDDAQQGIFNPSMPPPQQFGQVVHAVGISNDGLVYVCDRSNNRIQVFQKDGKFLFEEFVEKDTPINGSTWNIAFSHDLDQKYAYVPDGTNQCVWILDRNNLKTLGQFGSRGRYAGKFTWVHNIAVDSKGNIYTSEVHTGKRVQKFIYK